MTLANVTVEAAAELESALHTIFEKALSQEEFCDVYAEICEELETKCSVQELVRRITWNGLTYLLLEDSPPVMVAGPWRDMATACVERHLKTQKAPPNLVWIKGFSHCKTFFELWKSEDSQTHGYYVSIPIVLSGPIEIVNSAPVPDVHPVRTLLLQWCQRELEATNGDILRTKQRKLATCHFLGALFRRGFVKASTIHRCIEVLLEVRLNTAGNLDSLHPERAPDVVNMESLCTLLEAKSVGELLESRSKDSLVPNYYWELRKKSQDQRLPAKITSRLRSLIDLRANKWDVNGMEKEKTTNKIAQIIGSKRARAMNSHHV